MAPAFVPNRKPTHKDKGRGGRHEEEEEKRGEERREKGGKSWVPKRRRGSRESEINRRKNSTGLLISLLRYV